MSVVTETSATLAEPRVVLSFEDVKRLVEKTLADKGELVALRRGIQGTVLLRFSGATIGLVQPEEDSRASWRVSIQNTKKDLVMDLRERGPDYQGIVFLPYVKEIERSAAGAREMAAQGLSFERTPKNRDQVVSAVGFIVAWTARQAEHRLFVDDFGEKFRESLKRPPPST